MPITSVCVCVCICLGISGSSHINEVIFEALGNTIVYHNLNKIDYIDTDYTSTKGGKYLHIIVGVY
jgi:hypothetical protein